MLVKPNWIPLVYYLEWKKTADNETHTNETTQIEDKHYIAVASIQKSQNIFLKSIQIHLLGVYLAELT